MINMHVTAQITALRKETEGLNPNERANICCDWAKQMEKSGNYELAAEALDEFWPDRNKAPIVDGLDPAAAAKVVLRVGNLVGFLGSTTQTPGGQERAKDLITQSIEMFERLGDPTRAAEARGDLGLRYWREGAFDEARITLAAALASVDDTDADLKAVLLIRAAVVEAATRRLQNALNYCLRAEQLVEQSQDHFLKGAFHAHYGLVMRRLASPENREDYLDRALVEYAAASFHYEQAGNERDQAVVENNLGYLYSSLGRHKEAHKHLDRARSIFSNIRDLSRVAAIDDTRARVLLAEGRLHDAERVIRLSIKAFERGGEQAMLTESLTTYGVILARLGRHARSRELLERAVEVGEIAGDYEGAGRAKISLIEELRNQTSPAELAAEYESAVAMLKNSEDPATARRLIDSAKEIIDSLTASEDIQPNVDVSSWEAFSFKREVLKVEKAFIERALRDAGGSVTRASRLLGFRHHQSLIALINSRHRDLLGTRSAVRKRRHHLFSKPRKTRKTIPAGNGTAAAGSTQAEPTEVTIGAPTGERAG